MARISNTQRTLQLCRDLGWPAWMVERWITYQSKELDFDAPEFMRRAAAYLIAGSPREAGETLSDAIARCPPEQKHRPRGIRQDCFHIADVLVIDGAKGSLFVQSCSGSTVADHKRKVLDIERKHGYLSAWLRMENRFDIWGWRKLSASPIRGSRRRWWPRVESAHLRGPTVEFVAMSKEAVARWIHEETKRA